MEDLQVNVAQLLKGQVGGTKVVELDGPVLIEEGVQAPSHVRGKLTLTRTDRGVWASGNVSLSADADCSRCLTPFTLWVVINIDEVYLPSIEVNTGAKLRYDDPDDIDSLKIDEHHIIDFTEAFRQYRLAAMPLAPLCREDCKGICPQCGADLNGGPCGCEPEVDPRWAKLRELLS